MAVGDPFSEVRTPKLRIRVFAPGSPTQTITVDPARPDSLSQRTYPAKEWSLTDDILNISDSAAVTIANDDGQVSGAFVEGQTIEMEESDPDAANGKWIKVFTGILISIESHTDMQGGSNLLLSAMDKGWLLTQCKAEPLKNIKHVQFKQLLSTLLDPTWNFSDTETVNSNDLNRRLKHGRQVILQNFKPQLGAILPFIQVEPGQAPFDILQTYAAREGWLINVGAKGQLIFFRPNYTQDALYTLHFHGSRDDQRSRNNVIGRPTMKRTIDGLYSEAQCWSTVVIPPEIVNTENPNEMYRHSVATAVPNPLPFFRREVFSDPEAINEKLRENRAIWKLQMGRFQSFSYEAEFPAHSQGGALFVSDTIISMNDSINGVFDGHYVQSVQRSITLQRGVVSKLMIRKPGLLNPELASLDLGGGTKKAAGT